MRQQLRQAWRKALQVQEMNLPQQPRKKRRKRSRIAAAAFWRRERGLTDPANSLDQLQALTWEN